LDDLTLLEKGLSFIPTRKTLPVHNIIISRDKIIRNIKLKSFFNNRISNDAKDVVKTFTAPSSWCPHNDLLDSNCLNLVEKIKNSTDDILHNYSKDSSYIKLNELDNLTRGEKDSLKNLKNNKDILIKPADKGGATVIVNKSNYIIEAERQLNNMNYYRKLDKPIFTDNIPRIKTVLSNMLNDNFITKKQFEFLSGPAEVKNRTFYLLPKIHKPQETWPQPGLMPEGRPIVSDVDSETYRISEYIDHYINPLSVRHETYLKNTYDFIDKIRNVVIENNYMLVTGDVTSLYTNMDINRSLDCVRLAFSNNPEVTRPDKHLLDLLEISLKYNDFEFNDSFYLQTMGTAMGKRFAPALANLYLLDFDKIAKNNFRIKPLLFFRFLDDIFFVWPGDLNSLKEYELFLNSILPNIKVKLEYDLNEINFLDTSVYKCNNSLQTKVYFKPTDTHQLLHKDSFHPKHTFKGILKSQFIRYKRISSTKIDFDHSCKILMRALKSRGYSFSWMRTLKNDVWFNYVKRDNRESTVASPLLPIVVDYCNVGRTIGRDYKDIVKSDSLFKDTRVIVAYRNHKNLKQLLVKSKLEGDKQRFFRGCGNFNCKTCRVHSFDCGKFSSSNRKTDYLIKDDMCCNSNNIIYLITCSKCNAQYVGETSRSLRDRLNQHRSAIRNKLNTPIGLHFNSPEHSLLDLKIVAIELIKNDTTEGKYRKSREKYWQNELQTNFPKGLNGLNETNFSKL